MVYSPAIWLLSGSSKSLRPPPLRPMTYHRLLKSFPDYRRVWLGQLVSEVGDWFSNVAVFATIFELTHSGTAIGVWVVARHVPLFVFGPLAGVVADRISRKRIMVTADLVRAFLALGFLLIHRREQVWLAHVFIAALMAFSAFFSAAKKASLPNLVERRHLLVANALSASTTATTIALGSAIGGIVSAGLGREFAFVINALSFLFSMVMILRAHIPQTQHPPGSMAAAELNALQRAFHDFRSGLKYVRSTPIIVALVVIVTWWGFGNGVGRVVYSLYGAVLGTQEGRSEDFGIAALYVAMGCGGICGTFVARRFSAIGADRIRHVIGFGLLWDGACLALFSQSRWLPYAAVVLFLREIGYTVWSTCHQTLSMHAVHDAMRGRVMATQDTCATLAMTGSMLLAGPLIDRFGRAPIAFAGGCVILVAGVFWIVRLVSASTDTGSPVSPPAT